ncbi:SDR family NAD(P)-dependent oxidoreductase [Cerasicoccus frondis]|uniref:SDR family NAD(P)-dependent oxidoreductase n=1 Tax=Cerasicoccus frondis TaxID=490090 RepID=UPI0028527665|nr:SDR family oxidoreductase [Cerasicoccus frondis]
MPLTIDLTGKHALVTGVTSGIGAGIARVLAQAGANVFGCGRSELASKGAQEFLSNGKDEGVSVAYRQVDVLSGLELQELPLVMAEEFGGIDILISNAGNNVFKGAAGCTEGEWQHNMDLNLASHWRLANYCRPYLEQNGGVIQIMTSNHAFASMPGCFPYNVTKTALTGLVRSLAIEWGPRIRTVGIAPGFIDSAGNDKWFETFPNAVEARAKTIAMHPVGKLGTPEEIGGWCAFLASDYAAFASGATYIIDGGRLALLQDSMGN